MDKYDLLYKKYRAQVSKVIPDCIASRDEYESRFASKLEKMNIVALNSDRMEEGFLHYGLWTDELTHCYVPVYGYYAENEKTMVRLFQKLAEIVKGDYSVCEFSVNIYSGDTDCLTALHMMQFGNMSEQCVKPMEKKIISMDNFRIVALDKDEIEEHWKEIWAVTEQIVIHLQQSPVFYPGSEFTEEVYRDYFMSDYLELIAAYTGNKLAGIIEWNTESCELIGKEERSVNVGEAFVYPEFRGTGLAKMLLIYAEERAVSAGYNYMWVEHGTANPNARGFWNKYFTSYQYELVRRIG